ncbi:hypothetical protein JNUCC0626_20165 [Lentzea sp. JNUCC 0626]|uniref:hypothetical protein n=1 Tax=Lentzea sp. JNUCC 0626 TaxID=3367513 RepID=UPI003748D5CD
MGLFAAPLVAVLAAGLALVSAACARRDRLAIEAVAAELQAREDQRRAELLTRLPPELTGRVPGGGRHRTTTAGPPGRG